MLAMHELSIAEDLITLIEDVARQNGATRVEAAVVEVGELSGIEPDALELAFEVVRRDTLAADCQLTIERVPLLVACTSCDWQGHAEKLAPLCAVCASPVRVLGGRELRLKTIDIDEDESDGDSHGKEGEDGGGGNEGAKTAATEPLVAR